MLTLDSRLFHLDETSTMPDLMKYLEKVLENQSITASSSLNGAIKSLLSRNNVNAPSLLKVY
jgi:hypothetical protein